MWADIKPMKAASAHICTAHQPISSQVPMFCKRFEAFLTMYASCLLSAISTHVTAAQTERCACVISVAWSVHSCAHVRAVMKCGRASCLACSCFQQVLLRPCWHGRYVRVIGFVLLLPCTWRTGTLEHTSAGRTSRLLTSLCFKSYTVRKWRACTACECRRFPGRLTVWRACPDVLNCNKHRGWD